MKKSLLCMFLIFAACFSMTGCSSGKPADERPESITLRIATPPIGLDTADIFYAGSWNTSAWAEQGWIVPLDDIIDDGLRSDISETLWRQNSYKGHVYVLPYQQLHNTLAVNKKMMEEAGLEEFIPGDGRKPV